VRLSWYETDVKASIDYYRTNPNCKFITINGEQSIDKVHEDIVKATGLR